MHVLVLGPGRLGRSLAVLLPRAGHRVTLWRRGDPIPAADVAWVTVGDAAIGAVAALLPPALPALHAAGALGPEALGERPERGVLHPLMTFPGPEHGVPDLTGAGARVEGTPAALAVARALAADLGMVPFTLTGDRVLYHAAATTASAHVASVLLDAARWLARAGVAEADAAALLLPLATESLRRAARHGPAALTGPAARGDAATVAAHAERLGDPDRDVYLALAARILRARDGS